MATFTRLTMCKGCPFKKTSAPGWLGDYNPDEVIDAVWKEKHFMCHTKINYDDPNWDKKLDRKPHCAGALQMAKIMCKLPRDKEHSDAVKKCVVEENHLGKDFVDHHKRYQ